MNNRLYKLGIVRLWLVQLSIALILAVFCAVAFNGRSAISALLGGLVCLIPNAYFAIKLFKYQGARAAKQIVNDFYKGEAFKIVLSLVLFTLIFIFLKISPLAFFISYISIHMTHWFTPWIIINKQNGPKSD